MNFRLTDEIELRPYTMADAEKIFATVRENYDHLRQFLEWVIPEYSIEGVREFITQSQKDSAEKKRQGFGIFCHEKLVGSIGYNKFNWKCRSTEIGYWIARDFSGKGIITQACRVLIDNAFDQLKLNRIEIRCADQNIKSRAIPERLGFSLEGVLRQAICRREVIYDDIIYGLLKNDWKTR